MQPDYVKLVDLILSRGHCVSVDTGGDEPDVIKSTNRAEILMAIESVDCAEILAYPSKDSRKLRKYDCLFWALIIPFGVKADESVADYTDNGYWKSEVV